MKNVLLVSLFLALSCCVTATNANLVVTFQAGTDVSSDSILSKAGVTIAARGTLASVTTFSSKPYSIGVATLDVKLSPSAYISKVVLEGNKFMTGSKAHIACTDDYGSKISVSAYKATWNMATTPYSEISFACNVSLTISTITVTAVVDVSLAQLTLKAKNEDGFWATFSSASDVFFPDSLKVYAMKEDSDGVIIRDEANSFPLVKLADKEGHTVAANTGVLLFYPIAGGETRPDSVSVAYSCLNNLSQSNMAAANMLHPASEEMTDTTQYYLKLAYDNYDTQTGLGFYFGANDGGNFNIRENTAYLAVPRPEQTEQTEQPEEAAVAVVLTQTEEAEWIVPEVIIINDMEDTPAGGYEMPTATATKKIVNGQLVILTPSGVYNTLGQPIQ